MSAETRSADGDSLQQGDAESTFKIGKLPVETYPELSSCIVTDVCSDDGDDDASSDDRTWSSSDDNVPPTRIPARRSALRFTESVYMDRFGVLSAWLFLIQTIIQLVLVFDFDAAINRLVNIVFNADYLFMYLVFLALYSYMDKRPHAAYIGGVVLYAVGYLCFFLLFVLENASWLYHAGSSLFLVGSVGIVVGAFRGNQHTFKWQDFMPTKSEAAYVYGGVCFGVGSAVFCWDASPLTLLVPGDAVALGLGFFVVGRGFFLYGSQTSRCNIFLWDSSNGKK